MITYTTNTGASATLTIEVTPVDDASVLANDSNTIAEDTVATGNVLDNDSDIDSDLSVVSFTVNGETVAAGTTVEVEGGSLVINADGTYTFTPNDNWNGSVPVITYTTNTGASATLMITVTPDGDIPVFAGDDSGAVTEDASNPTLTDTGLLTIDDADAGQSVFQAGNGTPSNGALGSLTIDTNGNWTYNVANAEVQYLAEGETKVETFVVLSEDGTEHTVTITITGTNDVPTLLPDTGSVTEDTAVNVDGNLITSGILDAGTDGDAGEDKFTADTLTGQYGTLSVDAYGNWIYTADNSQSAIQNLNSGEFLTEEFKVYNADGVTWTTVTITINGVNDVSGGSNVDLTVDDANTLGSATDSDSAGLSFTAGAHDVTAFAFTNLNDITVDGLDGNLTWSLDASGNLIGSIGNTDVLQLSLTGNAISAGNAGSVSVSVTLLDNLSHNVSVNDLTVDGITVIATDASGATATGTVSVKVVDDGVDLTPQDLVGNNAVGQYEGVINVDGADQNYSADLSSNISGGGTFSNSGITAGGLTVFYYVDPSNPSILIAYSDASATPSAYDPDNNGQSIIFTLSIDPNSDSYQLDVVRPIDQVETITVADMSGGKGGNTPAAYVTFDGTNYIINNDISDVDPTHEMIFTLTSTSGLVSSTVNGNTNGFGVQNAWVDQGEALIVDYADNVASASIQFEGATYAHFKAYDANGNLLGEGDITSGQVISNLGEISYIEVSTSAQGNHANFQFTGTSAQNIVTETTDVDLDFNVTVTDSDGDSANGSIHVDLNAPGTNTPTSPTALTTGAMSLLSEGDLYSNGSDADSQQLRFKSGSESITSFQFGNTDNIQISGVNANIKWSFNDNGQLIGTFMGKEAISLTLNGGRIESGEEGSVSVTVELLDTFPHNVSAENLVISGIDVIAVDAQGNSATSSMTVQVADDAPEIADAATVAVSDTDIPDALVGSFSLTNSRGSSSDLDFDGFTITARGFTSATDSTLTESNIFGNSSGIGVQSVNSPYLNLAGEVDFRQFADGTSASEEVIITLDAGRLAYGVNIDFDNMFRGEREVGVVDFYRDGQLIGSQTFSSNADSGDYAERFNVMQGGFDQMVIRALDNGVNNPSDNSDFAIKRIEFLGYDDIASGYATGSVDTDWGADGIGSLVFDGTDENGLFTSDGQSILTSLSGNTLLGQTDSGELVFKVEFTPSTGQWEFYQYKAIEQTSDGQLDFNVSATDSDGDSAEGHFAVTPQVVVRDYIQTNGTDGDNTIDGSENHDVIVSDTSGIQIVQGENYNIAFILDSSGSMSSAIEAATSQLLQVFTTLQSSATGLHSGVVNVLLVDFDFDANISLSVNLADPNALDTLTLALSKISDDGWTNYEAAFDAAIEWFTNGDAASNNGTNLTYFITDGEPNYYMKETPITDIEVLDYKYSSDMGLADLIHLYTPGQALVYNGLEIIAANGIVYEWKEKGNNNGWGSKTEIGQLELDANGNYFVAIPTEGSNEAVSGAQSAFQVLDTLSNVEAIGIGSGISLNRLTPYDSDGNVATNIDASKLASVILGSEQLLLQGDDTVNSGDGNDIIFGDIVAFDGIEGQGYAALQKFVAQQTGENPADVSIQDVHEYVSANPSLFDTSRSDDGNDILAGNRGDDILFGQGGNDELHGGSGDDLLIGGSGLDHLIGGSGSDTLIGGLGDDTLTGGTDADTFVWQQGESGTDHITDFDINQDKLDLSDLLQGESGDNLSNYLHFSFNEGNTTISINADGDGDTDYDQFIVLDGVDLSSLGNTDGQIINSLLGNNGEGALIVDQSDDIATQSSASEQNLLDLNDSPIMIP
ncbi:VCBS domain-containing protein [Shewanella colwelliana]|uniref:VCBS domain-containing protein n=1 Tax=Shewanella colwelliana TaxID=23 RepID=UPI0004B9D751|nr:VCBS domain-containing protein [Shewanella colwelliana]